MPSGNIKPGGTSFFMQPDVIIRLKMAKRGLKRRQNLTYEVKTIKMKKFKLKTRRL